MPGKVVGSLVGLGGAAAAGLGFFVNAGVGWLLHLTHGKYEILFAVAASAYLVALLLIQLINPRWESAHEVAGEIKAPA